MKIRFKPITSEFIFIILFLVIQYLTSCEKVDNWLDAKSQLNDVRPATLKDLNAILDEDNQMNSSYPTYGLTGSDNYYLLDGNLQAASLLMQNLYKWEKKLFDGSVPLEWTYAYRMVGRTNIVLDELGKITPTEDNQTEFNHLKGRALFYRSLAFYNLAQTYCLPFAPENLEMDGLVIRVTSNVNIKPVRSTIRETYEIIIRDLEDAAELLPQFAGYQTRPGKGAALGLLSKTYLVMDHYEKALFYADLCIKNGNSLLDYNNALVSTSTTYRFPAFPGNPEILFFARGINNRNIGPQANAHGYIAPDLYLSYKPDDLRKGLLYSDSGNGKIQFRGTYSGDNTIFCGIALNEIYFIRMECAARLDKEEEALQDLNHLLSLRYKAGTFIPLEIMNKDELLLIVLEERRKELPFTAQIRWEDLRRLNKDPRFARTLERKVGGQVLQLPPNDKRYVYPIPDTEIQLSGISQNER